MSYERRKSSVVSVGNLKIGGDNPISLCYLWHLCYLLHLRM